MPKKEFCQNICVGFEHPKTTTNITPMMTDTFSDLLLRKILFFFFFLNYMCRSECSTESLKKKRKRQQQKKLVEKRVEFCVW